MRELWEEVGQLYFSTEKTAFPGSILIPVVNTDHHSGVVCGTALSLSWKLMMVYLAIGPYYSYIICKPLNSGALGKALQYTSQATQDHHCPETLISIVGVSAIGFDGHCTDHC